MHFLKLNKLVTMFNNIDPIYFHFLRISGCSPELISFKNNVKKTIGPSLENWSKNVKSSIVVAYIIPYTVFVTLKRF